MDYVFCLKILCGGFLLVILGSLVVWFVRVATRKRKGSRRLKKAAESFEQPPDVELRYDDVGFVTYCYDVMPRKKRIKMAEQALAEAEAKADVALTNLQTKCDCEAAAQWREARKDEMLKRATLANLREGKEIDKCLEQEFLADFEQVKSMRGVKQIYLEDGKLHVMVRVTYPCEGLLYDAGDFVAKFYKDKSFVALPVRTGWTPYSVCDAAGDEVFCFGDKRQEEIEAYLYNGRVVEAMELIIDSLYYIDNHDYERIPPRLKPIRALTRAEMKECRRERKKH